jgi:hypothetical protein
MQVCPFDPTSCGAPASQINFDIWDQVSKLTLTMTAGQTCAYKLRATCGLPTYLPSTLDGFEVRSIDYGEPDFQMASNPSRRLLQGFLQEEEPYDEEYQVLDFQE